MWSHQYDQQVNQVQCTINPDHNWTTNGPESNLYGLEPNFGCCTSNMHQGWPKFVSHLWMQSPTRAWWRRRGHRAASRRRCGTSRCAIDVQTDYPFRDTITVIVDPAAAARFPLHLRVPEWADGATVAVGAGPSAADGAGTLHRIERQWPKRPDVADDPVPDDAEGDHALQRGGGGGTRPAGLLAQDRRGVDARERRQAAPRTAARRLRGAPDDDRGTTASSWTRRSPRRRSRSRSGRSETQPFSPEGAGVVATRPRPQDPELEAAARLGRRAVAGRRRLVRPGTRGHRPAGRERSR